MFHYDDKLKCKPSAKTKRNNISDISINDDAVKKYYRNQKKNLPVPRKKNMNFLR